MRRLPIKRVERVARSAERHRSLGLTARFCSRALPGSSARRCRARGGLRRFTSISTAFVAGGHAGCISEDDLDVGQRFRNPYEQSKFEAERLVAHWRERLPVTVVRPSIVVGERDTGWTA